MTQALGLFGFFKHARVFYVMWIKFVLKKNNGIITFAPFLEYELYRIILFYKSFLFNNYSIQYKGQIINSIVKLGNLKLLM